jgi:hypothetical protein
MMQPAVRLWRTLERGGAIVNVVAGVSRGMPGIAHTCAARAGVIHLSKTVAVEWAPLGIRVNCVAPGVISTEGMNACLADLEAGLIVGKGGCPKKAGTIVTDKGSIARHIIPLIGTRKVRDVTKTDVNRLLKDVMAGKTATVVKTRNYGARLSSAAVGTATRTIGLLGGILTYAIDAGIIDTNPAHGIRRPKDAGLRTMYGSGASPRPSIVCWAGF